MNADTYVFSRNASEHEQTYFKLEPRDGHRLQIVMEFNGIKLDSY